MPESKEREYLERKSFEIAYIFVRIAESLKNRQFAERITENALSLMDGAIKNPSKDLIPVSRSLEFLTRLGADAGFIHRPSSEVICAELRKMNSAIAELDNRQTLPGEAEIAEAMKFRQSSESGKNEMRQSQKTIRQNISKEPAISENGKMRQTAILDKMRQTIGNESGNNNLCRIKDLQEAFPDISERTLRYDLSRLAEEGKIERMGSGGPSVSYRIKETRAIQLPGQV